MNGSCLINCDLSDSKFNKISINGINLNKSNLSRVNWIDCYTNDYPTLIISFNQVMCISTDDLSILVGGNGKI